MFKKSLIILIFIFLNISYLETNAVCTRDDFSDNDSYSKYLSWEWTCNGEYIYSDIAEQSNDLGEEYSKVEKIEAEINTQEQNLEVQEQILDQIENATKWTDWYEDLTPEERQEVIDNLYSAYKENWWDANWWVWWDNLTEAREDLAKQKEDLVQQKEDLAQQKEDLGIQADRLWKGAEQLSNNIDTWNELIKGNISDLTHNENALSDIKSDIKKLEWEKVEEVYEEANNVYEEASNAYEEASSSLSELNSDLDYAINNWASVAEIEAINQRIDSVKKAKEDAEFEQEWAASELEDAKKAKEDITKKKEKLDELREREEKAAEALETCKNSPEDCKKVYSDEQISEAKEKIKKAKEDAEFEQEWADSELEDARKEAAEQELEITTKKVITECSKWDTLACREAIADMNKAEVAKACIDEWSTACSEAKEVASMTEAMAEETKANIAANPWLKSLGSDETMNALLWITDNNVVASTAWSSETWWFSVLSGLTVWFKDSLTGLVQILAVWAFLFVWIRLAMARWNPEEFKKALMHMIYVILWIFIITIAWAAVVLVAWINI